MPVSFRSAHCQRGAGPCRAFQPIHPAAQCRPPPCNTSRPTQASPNRQSRQAAMALALATTPLATTHLQQRRTAAGVQAARQAPPRQQWVAAAAVSERRRLRRLRAADPSSSPPAPEVRPVDAWCSLSAGGPVATAAWQLWPSHRCRLHTPLPTFCCTPTNCPWLAPPLHAPAGRRRPAARGRR